MAFKRALTSFHWYCAHSLSIFAILFCRSLSSYCGCKPYPQPVSEHCGYCGIWEFGLISRMAWSCYRGLSCQTIARNQPLHTLLTDVMHRLCFPQPHQHSLEPAWATGIIRFDGRWLDGLLFVMPSAWSAIQSSFDKIFVIYFLWLFLDILI